MIFYTKRLNLPNKRTLRLKLSGFCGIDTEKTTSTLPCDWTAKCSGFGFENHRLVAGAGIDALTVADSTLSTIGQVPPMPFQGADYAFFIGKSNAKEENGAYFAVSANDGLYTCGCSIRGIWKYYPCKHKVKRAVPYLYGDRELLLMSGDFEGIMIFDGEKIEAVADALRVKDLCIHEERVFAVAEGKRNSVWFSGTFDPYHWNVSQEEAGYIDFDGSIGEVNAVRSLGEYLYVFCDYGIYRLSVYADQTKFGMKKIYEDSSLIYSASIVDCAGKIVFAGMDGLRVFDGYDVGFPRINIGDVWQSTREMCSGCYCEGYYYLSMPSREQSDGWFSDTGEYDLLCLRMKDLSVQMINRVDLHDLRLLRTPVQTCAVGIGKQSDRLARIDRTGLIYGQAPTRIWSEEGIDFGESLKEKVVRGLEYDTRTPYRLRVRADNECKEFDVKPDRHYLEIGMKGKRFGFDLICISPDVEIDAPTVLVDILKR